ncbi:MAG: hypothetical protein JXM71_04845 [Spirochaetales bacterium]|nr:hypothetical protein [Spirochaetales bacterium]
MRKFIVFVVAASVAIGSLCAQEGSGEADEAYVLQKARDELSGSTGQTTTVTVEITTETAGSSPSEVRQYTPLVIGFVPGLNIPFGIYDTSISAAAIGALTGSVYGVQGSGVFNLADGVRGAQAAGVFNISDDVRGVQGAGVFNIADDVRGIQSAGIFNIADHVNGAQAAGVINMADSVHGIQLSGVVNVADQCEGAMIGLVNIADELDGVAIGLINIIGNGIHDIGFDYLPDSDAAYATYRSGTPFLYATFFVGQPVQGLGLSGEGLSVGGALGHRFRFLFLTADVELGSETRLDSTALVALASAVAAKDPDSLRGIDPWDVSFGSIRASFGFGNRKGFGPYVGIKTDFAPSGSGAIPASMRSSFGSSSPYTLTLLGTELEFWPKWFFGIKF